MRARLRVLLALLHVAARVQQVESQAVLAGVVAQGIQDMIDKTCEKNNHFVPVFLGIWGCQECSFGSHSPKGFACEACPANTVVSNGKWDKSISDWCETDCFKAWKDFLPMDTGTKAWYIESFKSFPCVASIGNTPFQSCYHGKKECADLKSRCTNVDDSWAQSSVIIFTEKWDKDYFYGNGYRECRLCNKGMYKDPNSKQCVSCPSGFVGALSSEDTSDFIPPDVRLATKKISTTTFPPGNYVLFGCRVCSDFQGVPTDGACKICNPGQYQRASLETVKHPSGAQFSVVVGVECKVCSPGYEFWNRVENSRSIQCRSFNSQDCCRPCGENQYSRQGEQCQAVASDHVGYNVTSNEVVAIGASAQRQCKQGEELVYCKEGQCSTLQSKTNTLQSNTKPGWRTCKPCQLSRTKRFLENSECEECSKQNKDLPNKDNVCESCTLCDKLEVSSAVHILHEIPDAIQTVYDFLPKFDYDGMYVTEKVTAKCVELGRRLVFVKNNDVTFQGVDQYRKDLQDPEVYSVSKFEAIFRLGSSCSKVLCSELCFRLNPFHYTPSCGTTTTDQREIWVYNGSKTLALADVESETKKKNGMYVSNGPCTLCTLCQQGWYNYGCNVYSDGVPHPRGECRECMSKCNDIDTFMYHPDGDGKCHVPPFILRHPSGKWKVEQNYVCKKCPTWVLEKHPNGKMTMSVATACGLRLSFTAYDFENGNVVTKTHAIVQWNEREEDEQKFGGVNWLNYRGFMRDLIPYCPRMYFYDDKEQNCDENSLRLYGHESYDVPGTNRKVTYGFSPYNPKCCKLCKSFDPLRSKRREDWEVCPGNTTVDVQNANVDKCGRGYYEHANTSQCRKCSTCHEGMIQP